MSTLHLIFSDASETPFWINTVLQGELVVLMNDCEKIANYIQKNNPELNVRRLSSASDSFDNKQNNYIYMDEFVTICAKSSQIVSW